MAKIVRIAAIQFASRSARGAADAHDVVLAETRAGLMNCAGYGLDLVVVSEGVEAVGQSCGEAEEPGSPGPYLSMYSGCARELGSHVVGSARVRDERGVHNCAVLFAPDGEMVTYYGKTYPTDGELENGIVRGTGAVVADTAIGRIGFAICFDLNFADLRSQYADLQPDIIAFPSMFHGGLLQTFWAYDCRCYFVSATQMAGCGIIDPFGRPLKTSDEYTAVPMATVNLDYAMVHLDYNRDKFPEIRRRYGPEVTIDIPAHVGSALVVSHSDSRTALDIVQEFGLELLDDYMARSRRLREAE